MDSCSTLGLSLYGISPETWAIIAATIIGPVASVLIALFVARWRERITATRERRMAIFRTLMATRRQRINVDHVSALNLVEVEFYGVPNIIQAWNFYRDHLSSAPTDRAMTESELKLFNEKSSDLLAKLLHQLGIFLNFKIGEIDIRNGGYSPQGWDDRDRRHWLIQSFIIDLAEGKRCIPVAVLDYAQKNPAPSSN